MIICDPSAIYYRPSLWVFDLIRDAYGIDIAADNQLSITIGHKTSSSLQVHQKFYQQIFEQQNFDHEEIMSDTPLIVNENGTPDYLSTIFYLVNCIQEYKPHQNKLDKYSRYSYEASLQSKYGILEENYVDLLIKKLLNHIDPKIKFPQHKTKVFFSHDIDSVYGSLKYDGKWALKNGNMRDMLSIIKNTFANAPAWFNMDRIAQIEANHQIKATYYWITSNGRSKDGIKNADYSIDNKKIQYQKSIVESFGNKSGLHKSTMKTSFADERARIDDTVHNRYHFLKMHIPQSWSEMQTNGIKTDASLGFPNHMGFRNSFGLPFRPYCLYTNKTIDVLEIPLTLMDGMFDIVDQNTSDLAFERITRFINKNKYNAVISILWHNSEMTEYAYKWSFYCYKRLLKFVQENEYECITPDDLITSA